MSSAFIDLIGNRGGIIDRPFHLQPLLRARSHLRPITPRRGGYILNLGQASDGEPNDLNHSESEFVSQTVNETEVGVREPNGSGLEFVIRHRCSSYSSTHRRVVAEEQ
jgi:hypothetical protein